MSNIYMTSWDRNTWISTTVFIILLLVGSAWSLFDGLRLLRESKTLAVTLMVIGGIGIISLLITAILAPIKYSLSSSNIVIKRIGPDIAIPLSDISKIDKISGDKVFNKAIRTCASGGAFGYFGKWKNPEIGNFTMYATHIDVVAVIKRNDGSILVISPDMIDEFMDAVKKRLG